MTLRLVATLALMALAAACADPPGPPLAATDVIVRVPSPEAKMAGGYFRLSNNSGQSLTIVRVTSPQFASVEMHETIIENDVARMRPLAAVDVATGESITFEPGGRHLMMSSAGAGISPGMPVTIELHDADGIVLSVSTTVVSMTGSRESQME